MSFLLDYDNLFLTEYKEGQGWGYVFTAVHNVTIDLLLIKICQTKQPKYQVVNNHIGGSPPHVKSPGVR